MRKGGSGAKGAEFERWVCATISMWVSDGQRTDLFSRNILSGGRFTIRVKAGDSEHGAPGDIRANHPLAYSFLDKFLIECKHYKSLEFDAFLFDHRRTGLLSGFLTKARQEAAHAGVRMMLIGKQNNRPPFLMLDADTAKAALALPGRLAKPAHHCFRIGEDKPVYMFLLDPFLKTIWLRQWLTVLPPMEK